MTLAYSTTLFAIGALFIFLALTLFEKKRGVRIAEGMRTKLDAKMIKIAFILHHVDWSAFVRETLINGFESLVHRAVHNLLLFVRTIEKFLSTTVVQLRERRLQSLSKPRGRTIRSLRGVRMRVPVSTVEISTDIMVESKGTTEEPEPGL